MANDDIFIVQSMKDSLETGFRMLMAKYKEPVYWHIRRLVVSHYDAQDAVQETFVRIFRSFRHYRGDSTLAAWIYRIATNEALRVIGRRGEQCSLDSLEPYSGSLMADEYVDYSDLEAVKLQKAILSLPTKQQLAFNLRYYDEMEYDEIAQVMESTPESVKSNYHLAKDKIISYLKSNI